MSQLLNEAFGAALSFGQVLRGLDEMEVAVPKSKYPSLILPNAQYLRFENAFKPEIFQ